MSNPDPEVIYLTPPCSKDADFGRMWSEDGASDCECDPPCKPTKYVRADLCGKLVEVPPPPPLPYPDED
jgi:hypothetical protein